MRIVLSSLLLTLALSSCASGGATGGQRRSPNAITTAELRQADGLTAFQAIQQMRPRWLRGRGGSSVFGGLILPKVVVDETQYREIQDLQSISVSAIAELRFLSAADATTRFGTGYPAGAILVSLR